MSASKVAAQTGYNFVTIACTALSGLVLTALVARSLGPDHMGTYSLIVWLMTMAGILINLGLVTTTLKFMAEALGRDDTAEAGGILAYGLKQLLINGAVVTLAWFASLPWAASAYHQPGLPDLAPIAALALVPTALVALLTAACQGLQRYGRVATASAVNTAIVLVGALVSLKGGFGIAGLLATNGLAALVTCGIYMRELAGWQPGWWNMGIKPERRTALRRYGASLMVLILLDAIVWQRSAVFFLGLWRPVAEVAYFAMASALATMAMKLIPGTLVGLLIPSMARSFGRGQLDEVTSVYHAAGRWMAVMALPVATGGIVLATPLVVAMYGAQYAPMAPILGLLLGAGALVNIFGFPASSVLYAVDGQQQMVKIGLLAGVANVVLMALLVPTWGAPGAAAATAFAQLLVLPPGVRCAGLRLAGARPDTRRLPGVALAATLMAAAVWLVTSHLSAHLALVVGIPLGGLLYPPLLFLCRALPPEDLARVREVAQRFGRKASGRESAAGV